MLARPYGRPVEGFTRADCIGISHNGKDQEIRWKSKTNPSDLNKSHRGGLCLKLYLQNTKLYSYSLIEPDPDGAIKRYWDNARWNETIKHCSGNWGHGNNEPAIGLLSLPETEQPSGVRFSPGRCANAKWS